MATKNILAACLAAAVWGFGGAACFAQIYIEQRPQTPQVYNLRIVNDMGHPICLKIMGYGTWRSYYAILAPGQIAANKKFYSGSRIVTAWDNTSGDLILLSRVNFDRNGTLHIRRRPSSGKSDQESSEKIPEDITSVLAPDMKIEAE
ncbi:MAG: hypothetical protein JXB10_18860 [Pirellulales bacterium]|nr:hypothetical protein [Pirellulales bacterium]